MLQSILFIVFLALVTLVVAVTSKIVARLFIRLNIKQKIIETLIAFLITLSIVLGLLYITPSYMPVVTFENDSGQQLVFIGMQHVGKKQYYEQVNDRVIALRGLGYIVLHEGVGMNGDVSVNLRSCSKVTEKESPTGLVSQPDCIGELQPGDKYADISQSDFLTLYSKHLESLGVPEDDAKKSANTKASKVNNEKQAIKSSFIKYIGLKIAVSYKSIQYFTSHNWDDNVSDFPVILGERNKILANYVISERKTVTAYGLAHLAGVKKILLEKDSSWRIISIDALNSL